MEAFIAKYGVEILLSLATAGALAFCKYLHRQLKNYQALLNEQESNATDTQIEQHLEPITNDIEELRRYIISIAQEENRKMGLIISSYRYRLIALCKLYLRQGYMTEGQYDQLTEFYKLYNGLGGNGQAKEYYEKAIELPIKNAFTEE